MALVPHRSSIINPIKRGAEAPRRRSRKTRVLVAVAPASAAAARLGARLVDRQRSTAVLLTGKAGDGGLRLVVVSVLDEAEALRPSGVPVGDDGDGIDVSVLRKEVAKVVFAGVVGKVTDIELHRNRSSTRRLVSDSVAPLGGADFPWDSSDFLRARNACEKASDTRRRVV